MKDERKNTLKSRHRYLKNHLHVSLCCNVISSHMRKSYTVVDRSLQNQKTEYLFVLFLETDKNPTLCYSLEYVKCSAASFTLYACNADVVHLVQRIYVYDVHVK